VSVCVFVSVCVWVFVCVCVCVFTAFTGLAKLFLALHKEHSVMKTDFPQRLPYPYDF